MPAKLLFKVGWPLRSPTLTRRLRAFRHPRLRGPDQPRRNGGPLRYDGQRMSAKPRRASGLRAFNWRRRAYAADWLVGVRRPQLGPRAAGIEQGWLTGANAGARDLTGAQTVAGIDADLRSRRSCRSPATGRVITFGGVRCVPCRKL